MDMALRRFSFRLCVAIAVLISHGCDRGGKPTGSADGPNGTAATSLASPAAVEAVSVEGLLEQARRLQQLQDYDRAMELVTKVFIQEPDNLDAKWLAAQLASARGNHQIAMELASSIDRSSRLGKMAVELQVASLIKLGRESQACDLLLEAIEAGEEVPRWRHELWRSLNRVGRRQEASTQAIQLCQLGQATEQELLSLISRSLSFPTPMMLKERKQESAADRLFADGLGKARWYYSLGEHQRAIDELNDHELSATVDAEAISPAVEALYGRLLAETQQWEEFRQWGSQVSEQAKGMADYWAAIGAFLIDNHKNEAAARALLEAVRRDSTDRFSVQRLSRVLFALERDEDGAQFQQRGIDINHTEREAAILYADPGHKEARSQLARHVLLLGRPFETLAWTLSMMPVGAVEPRNQVNLQRENLLRDPNALAMATETALLGVDPNDFQMDATWNELMAASGAIRNRPVVRRKPVSATPHLVNRAEELGLRFQWYKDVEIELESIPIHESLGGGVAVLDYDLDGWPDVYLAQGAGDPPTDQCTQSSLLFRNESQRFQDETEPAGAADRNYSSGLAAGDVNQDGFPDLYLGSLGHNRLLINNGDGTFRDATTQLGDAPDRFTASIAIADINGDRLPDLFESNYIEMEGGFALPKVGEDGLLDAPTPLSHYAEMDRWFENLGDGRFAVHEIGRDVAKPGTSLGVVITDFGGDGKNEVFVGNDVRPNHFLVLSEDNRFVNLADANGLANGLEGAPNGCMGIATGDFNRDGLFDMQIANFALEPANLYLQTPSGNFTDQSVRYGLADLTRPYVGFGTKAVDVDRNGFLDFIVANGHIFDNRRFGETFQMAPQLLMSDGVRLQPVKVVDPSGYWQGAYLGRAITLLDFDRDGSIDFLVNHLDQPLALLHDQTDAKGHWLQLELVGTESERDAIGAKVQLTVGDEQWTQWVTAGDGYFSSDEPIVVFAMDVPEESGQIEVSWPSGGQQVWERVQLDRRYLVVEGQPQVDAR